MSFASNTFLGCYQYIQIEDTKSTLTLMFSGVPQDIILGPVLFNLYVAENEDFMSSTLRRYADVTAIYQHCKIRELHTCIDDIERDVDRLILWLCNDNLIVDCGGFQFILFFSFRMSSNIIPVFPMPVFASYRNQSIDLRVKYARIRAFTDPYSPV